MASALWMPGLYNLTRGISGYELELVGKHAKYRNLDIVIKPTNGFLDKELDYWRKKFTKYILSEADQIFLRNLYSQRKKYGPYKKDSQKEAFEAQPPIWDLINSCSVSATKIPS